MIVNPPSSSATAATLPQTGTPSAHPDSPDSTRSHASEPPLAQPVPSVHARKMPDPLALEVSTGCFRCPALPGTETGVAESPALPPIFEYQTCPAVSQAASNLPSSSSPKDIVLIGHIEIFHGPRTLD